MSLDRHKIDVDESMIDASNELNSRFQHILFSLLSNPSIFKDEECIGNVFRLAKKITIKTRKIDR